MAASAHAATWEGRSLASVLADARSFGIVVIYSDQQITPDLKIRQEPKAREPLARLQEVLAEFNLVLQRIDGNTYAISAAPRAAQPPPEPSYVFTPADSEIVVQTSRYTTTQWSDNGLSTVAADQLKKLPGSNEDALRALQRLPGSSASGLSARSHVRGGYEDEIAVFFDGVQLFNPFHLKDFLGLFGLIDPEVVHSIDYYSGGFPVRFGSKDSATIDIHPGRNGPPNNLLSVSELYSRVIGSGSFDQDRGDWLVGYRRSNLSLVLNALDRDVGSPNFEDILGRFSYAFNDSLRVTTGVLALNDRVDVFTVSHDEQVRANYRDSYAWLTLESRWTDWLANRTQFAHANLAGDRNGTATHPNISNGALADSRDARMDTLSSDWVATLNTATSLQWGLQANQGEAHYNYSAQAQFYDPLATTFHRPDLLDRRFVLAPEGWQYAANLSLRAQWGQWSSELGVRWDDQSYIRNSSRISPRLALHYQMDAQSAFRLSAGRYVQPQTISELGLDENTFRFYKPDSLEQVVASFDRQLTQSLSLRLEAYYKWIDDIRPRFENLLNVFVLLPDIAVDRVRLMPGQARAQGVELYLMSNTNKWSWWAAYALSRVNDDFNGVTTRRSWDQPQSIKAGFVYTHQRWQVGANFNWHTGWPYTPLTFTPTAASFTSATLGARNSARFGDYSSLDLSAQYSQPLRLGTLEYFADIRNVLNRMNECCRNVDIEANSDGSFRARVTREEWLSRVPIVGINWRF